MALNDDFNEEIRIQTRIEEETRELRDRFEHDYGLWRLEPFSISPDQGAYDNYTTNSPAVLGNKIVDTLSDARVKFQITITDEDMKQRKHLSMTEKFCYGMRHMCDRQLMATRQPDSLSQLSWFAPIRGWLAGRFVMYEDEGAIKADLAIWDALNTYWLEGKDGLCWACYVRWVTPKQLEEEYGVNDEKPDVHGLVKVYNFWDFSYDGKGEEAVVLPKEGYIKKEQHGLEPSCIYIMPVGAAPYVQSGRFMDTIRSNGESVYKNNRNLYPTQNKLRTYALTTVGMATHTPTVIYYTGTKPQINDNPYTKGSTILVKVDPQAPANANRHEPFVKPQMGEEAWRLNSTVEGDISIGGMAPVSYGLVNQQLPAAGINMLTGAAMHTMKPSIKAIQQFYEWFCREAIYQYKNGDFGELKLQGKDYANRKFKVEVTPKQIEDEWEVECSLKPDMPQDDFQNAGIATQLVREGIMSRQTAMDRYLPIDDITQELENLDREKATGDALLTIRRVANALDEDGDKEGAMILRQMGREMLVQRMGMGNRGGMPQKGGGGPRIPGMPAPTYPYMVNQGRATMTKGLRSQVPEELKNAVRQAAQRRQLPVGGTQ